MCACIINLLFYLKAVSIINVNFKSPRDTKLAICPLVSLEAKKK